MWFALFTKKMDYIKIRQHGKIKEINCKSEHHPISLHADDIIFYITDQITPSFPNLQIHALQIKEIKPNTEMHLQFLVNTENTTKNRNTLHRKKTQANTHI